MPQKTISSELGIPEFWINQRLQMDGIDLLNKIFPSTISCAFFDPQYRGILEKMDYGNEGERQKGRSLLPQMSDATIQNFANGITDALKPSGYLFMWTDKFHLCEGTHKETFKYRNEMNLVSMITWSTGKFGMGYRTRAASEFLLIYQKNPKIIKTWKNRSIRDVWEEKIPNPRSSGTHPHQKPILLIKTLIESVSEPGEIVLDPCAGSFVTMDACRFLDRKFLGCDLLEFS